MAKLHVRVLSDHRFRRQRGQHLPEVSAAFVSNALETICGTPILGLDNDQRPHCGGWDRSITGRPRRGERPPKGGPAETLPVIDTDKVAGETRIPIERPRRLRQRQDIIGSAPSGGPLT